MSYLKIAVFVILALSCQQAESDMTDDRRVETPAVLQADPPAISYSEMLAQNEKKRQFLAKAYQAASAKNDFLDSVSGVFTEMLLDSIVPYWYGTPWTFTGHTDVPNEGSVACGYFVSTTLKHMGIHLNRYKMAQQASMLEVKSIAIFPNKMMKMVNPNLKEFEKLMPGLYIVGLDNHVGFILRKPNQTYFIHSDYVSVKVRKERIEESAAFRSQLYYLAPITHNRALMKKWLTGQKVKIYLP